MSWIVDEIEARGGLVAFDQFMELALYHPEHGYYSRATPRYGRCGDYLTAPTASEWYPRVLARVLSSTARGVGRLRLVDVASGDGALIAGVLESLGAGANEVLVGIVSVERSEAMRSRQIECLATAPGLACISHQLPATAADAPHPAGFSRLRVLDVPSSTPPRPSGRKPSWARHLAALAMKPGEKCRLVGWVSSISELEPAPGPTVIHASELYDAQPVVRVVGWDDGVRELWVGIDGGNLEWVEHPPRDEVASYFEGHGVVLAEGQIAEANLNAGAMHRRILAAAGDNGLCLVLDYGYEASRLYDPRGRAGGSLATFRRHQFSRDPLASPGEIDLTAHVNWDDLRLAADAEDWTEIGLWPLAEFLVRAGIGEELEERGLGMEADLDAATVTARQEIKRLLEPEGMGSDLKMLVQAKGEMIEVARSVLSFEF